MSKIQARPESKCKYDFVFCVPNIELTADLKAEVRGRAHRGIGMGSGKEPDLELEKARLVSLALDFGFDEDTAKKCLDRLVTLYGTHFCS